MTQQSVFHFPPFRLDAANQTLWRGEDVVSLRPKAFELLRYMLERPGQLLTKDDLLEACWPDTTVTDTVLKVCIREIREALSDDPQKPLFIETAHRRGYRFIGRMEEKKVEKPAVSQFRRGETNLLSLTHRLMFVTSPLDGLVGRMGALAQLRGRLERARKGERQMVFVTGEAGIGKTTLVEAFLQTVGEMPDLLIARGQCLEGGGEAYGPLMEAFSRLCREAGGPELVGILKRYAPHWLLQMPSLPMNEAERAEAERRVAGATPERMLREMVEAIEALTERRSLALVLEDLHWGDTATVNLLGALARRFGPSRLMILSTYRPVEAALNDHKLKSLRQELAAHKLCKEVALDYLGEEAVGALLKSRFASNNFPAGLSRFLHDRTGGNPLFLTGTLDYLMTQRLIDEHEGCWQLTCDLSELGSDVPVSIRELIERHLAQLTPLQQRALEAGSGIGLEFNASEAAAVLGEDVLEVEEQCDALARLHHFLRPLGVSRLADGTLSARYGFVHAVHRNVLYQRVTPARRARWQQQLIVTHKEAPGSELTAFSERPTLILPPRRSSRFSLAAL